MDGARGRRRARSLRAVFLPVGTIGVGIATLLAARTARATCWRHCQIVPMLADCTVPARPPDWSAKTPVAVSAWCEQGCDAVPIRGPRQVTEAEAEAVRVLTPSGQPIDARFRAAGKACGEIPLVALDRPLPAGEYTIRHDDASISLRVTSDAVEHKPAVACKTVCRVAPKFTDCTEPESELHWPPSVPLSMTASCVESCEHVRRTWSEPTGVPLDRLHVNEHPWPDRGQVPGAFRTTAVTCAGVPLFTFDGALAKRVRYNVLLDGWVTLQFVASGTLARKGDRPPPPASEPRRGGCSGCASAPGSTPSGAAEAAAFVAILVLLGRVRVLIDRLCSRV